MHHDYARCIFHIDEALSLSLSLIIVPWEEGGPTQYIVRTYHIAITMAKGIKKKGRRKQQQGGNDRSSPTPNDDDDCDGDEKEADAVTQEAAQTTARDDDDIDFAQRRELQRKAACEKRRARQQCHQCGKAGHVQRNCPRTSSSADTRMPVVNKEGSANAKGRKPLKTKSSELHFPELPAGFSNNPEERTSSSKQEASTTTTLTDEAFLYCDASCDIAATIEYLRFGRGKNNTLTVKEATDIYQTSIDTAREFSNYGGCISRSPLLKPGGRPWTSPLKSRNDAWYVVGLGRDFLYNDDDSESATACLLETLLSSSGNDHHETCRIVAVGFFADLDYTPEMLSRPGCDRESQLRRLACTCHAAGQANVAIQIRASPGVGVVSSLSSGADDSIDCSYATATKDLLQVLTATMATYPLLKVHLSCWSGGADRMMSLLQAFPNGNLYFGFDATVTFSKASHIHECAFDVPLTKVVLETGRTNTIPAVVARFMGRDAFSHSGLVPFVAEALAAIKGKHDGTVTAAHVARMATQNTLKLYPQLLASKEMNCSDRGA
jgi:TatD related DNase